MKIQSLSYILVETTNVQKWANYANDVVGLMRNDSLSDDTNLFLRMDERSFRFHITHGSSDKYLTAGFELKDKEAFDDAKNSLEQEGIAISICDASVAASRGVAEVLSFQDPAGNSLELCHGSLHESTPFISPQDIKGFITKGLGFGHVVFAAPNLEEAHDFYINVLGFADSDYMHFPMGPAPDAPQVKLNFMHCDNPRHHTVALYESPIPPSGLIHTMVEVNNIDEVGKGLDRAMQSGTHISSSLGRHSNDMMVSFYMQTPAGFDLEFGYDGWQVDWADFDVQESNFPSFWGHAFSPPEG